MIESSTKKRGFTGRVLPLSPVLMKTAATEDKRTPQPISRKPVHGKLDCKSGTIFGLEWDSL